MTLLATFVVVVFVYSLVSRRLDATVVTGPIVFTLAGVTMQAVAPVGFGVGDNTKIFLYLSEVGLTLLLFSEAARTDRKSTRQNSSHNTLSRMPSSA